MPDLTRREIENALLNALEFSRERYQMGSIGRDEYVNALRMFNDFVLHGKVPRHMPPSE